MREPPEPKPVAARTGKGAGRPDVARLKAALKANMARRKAQAKGWAGEAAADAADAQEHDAENGA